MDSRSFLIARWVYLRALGLIYLVALGSLSTQIPGLVGSRGILPCGTPDFVLSLVSAAGILASLCVVGGLAVWPCLAFLWGLYLFLAYQCQDFLWFQWDGLMLEMGLLALFLAPGDLRPHGLRRALEEEPVPGLSLLLHRWLLFRLIFFSGYVKLASGDPTWRDLTALAFHYETQPIPTWISWYVHQLPVIFHRLSTIAMFALELAMPFVFFLGRRARIAGFFGVIGLQLWIDITGNYGFFGWQTAALGVLLLDDQILGKVLRISAIRRSKKPAKNPSPAWIRARSFSLAGMAAVVILATALPGSPVQRWVSPLRSFNSYGVFAVMTTNRSEIVVEGSHDGKTWLPYEFKWKPGDPARRPFFVEPHMPRLDWQMWFAALSDFERTPWFSGLLLRLLQGTPEVLALLDSNPFPGTPPKFVRAQRYGYRFSDWRTGRDSGTWWTRELLGAYSPSVSLK